MVDVHTHILPSVTSVRSTDIMKMHFCKKKEANCESVKVRKTVFTPHELKKLVVITARVIFWEWTRCLHVCKTHMKYVRVYKSP